MTQCTVESPSSVHFTMEADCSRADCALMLEDPPTYSDRDFSVNSEQPPPPPYAVPLEHPPPYQTPPRSAASPILRFSPGQSCQRNVGLMSNDLRNIVIYEQSSNMSCLSLILACSVFWLCGFIFGAVAFVLAKMSLRNSQSPRNQKMNLYLGRASIAISFLGIAFGAIVLTVVMSFARSRSVAGCLVVVPLPTNLTAVPPEAVHAVTTTSGPLCALIVDNTCYKYSSSFSRLECAELGGLVEIDQETHRFVCYHNKCDDYSVRTMCFKHRSAALSVVECQLLNGLFDVTFAGSSCYYNKCPGFSPRDNKCYRTRTLSSRADCVDKYYEDGFCYST